MVEQAIREITCKRCGRVPTDASDKQLNHGYCIVCWDKRAVRDMKAEERAISRLKALHTGTWRTPDERDTDDRGTVQATVNDIR